MMSFILFGLMWGGYKYREVREEYYRQLLEARIIKRKEKKRSCALPVTAANNFSFFSVAAFYRAVKTPRPTKRIFSGRL